MKRALSLAGPVGLLLLVVGSGWAALVPDVLPWVHRLLLGTGTVLVAAGLWVSRDRWFGGSGGRRVRHGAGALASTGLAVALLLLVNFFSARYHEQWDLTRTGAFSLHPATLRVLEQIDRPVEIYAFFPISEQGLFRAVRNQYELFASRQPLLKVRVVDPNQQPDLFAKAGRPGNKTTVVLAGERRVVFPGNEEEDLAAALLEVNRSEPKVLYWVIGHGERELGEGGGLGFRRLQADLIKDFYEIRPLSLGAAEQVPADASLVIVADPKRPITAAEAAAYDAYLRRGGRMLALVDVAAPAGDAAEGPLAPLLDRWGLRPQDAIVIDPRGRTGDPDPRNVVGDAFPHPAMRAMAGQICLFPLARPIDFRTVLSDQQIFHAAIVAPGPDRDGQRKDPYVDEDLSLAEAPLEKVAALPLRGPQPTLIPLVISAYRKLEPAPGQAGAGTEARLVVAGDADFLSDRNFDLVGNREFALNLIRWLTGQELLIRREGERRVAKEAMSVSSAQMRLVWALGAGLPLAIFLTGWTVWFVRRSK